MSTYFARCSAACILAVALCVPTIASAQVFSEDWESGSSRWLAGDGNPISLATEANTCSSTYQHETAPSTGGRVVTRAGIPVSGGNAYCLVAWLRAASGAQPFLGIHLSDAAGAPTTGGEHWLIGNAAYPDGYGGTVEAVTPDGVWRWYSRAFTLEPSATFLVIKDEILQLGTPGQPADFDDIRLYAGPCPTSPVGAAHITCAGPTPVCVTGQCVECGANADCRDPTRPTCDVPHGVCVCTSGTCGRDACATDVDCTTDPNRVCDTAITPHACVECTADRGCAAGRVCSSATNTCVAASDGGAPDGGAPDGGAPDGGAPDGGAATRPTLECGGCHCSFARGSDAPRDIPVALGAALALGLLSSRRRRM